MPKNTQPMKTAESPKPSEAPKPMPVTVNAFNLRRKGVNWVIQTLAIVDGMVISVSDNDADTLGMQLARFERLITKEFR